MKTIVSVFDGMSCGQIAINSFTKDYKYFASEVEVAPIKITQHNFPNTNQIGDIRNISYKDGVLYSDNGEFEVGDVYLFMGGSPCQNFSFAGKAKGMVTKDNLEIINLEQYLELKKEEFEFEGQSYLFWEYVRLLKEINPKYFLLENVKMKKEWQNVISKELCCEPIKINSNLVSAQNRERLYWTNIPNVTQPEDGCIFIEDILDTDFDDKYWLKEKNTELLLNKVNINNAPNIACIDVYNKKVKLDRKCPTLTLPHHNSIRLLQNGRIRKLTPNECEKLQNIPLDYTDCDLSDIHRYSMLGNGWTVDIIKHILKNIF